MQEERFEVFFQNISGLYRAVQRLRAQFAQMSGVSSVHLFWLYLLREYPEGLAASRLAELSNIDRSLVSRQLQAASGARTGTDRGADRKAALRLENPPDAGGHCTGRGNCRAGACDSEPRRARRVGGGAGGVLPCSRCAEPEFQRNIHFRRIP